jgi:protein TonB
MLNEKRMRFLLFTGVAAVHLLLIFFLAFSMTVAPQSPPEYASVMKLTDFIEHIPLPPRPPVVHESEDIPSVESIAETMIETDTPPEQNVLAAGVFLTTPSGSVTVEENYLPMHQVSHPPQFDANAIASDLVYPPIALRSGIEGRVILELFVDRTGTVQRIEILQENPTDRGFGEAAVKAFTNRKGVPAQANGQPVSARYRYPVTFRIR